MVRLQSAERAMYRVGWQGWSFLEYSCGHTQRSSVWRCGKADDESGSLPVGIVVAENFSPMLLHDAVADAEAEAGSLANLFGGEEGIEDTIGMGDAVAIVAEGYIDGVAVEVVGPQLNGAAQNQVELHSIALRGHLPGEAEQVLHDGFGALGFLQNDAEIFPRTLGNLRIFEQQIGKAEDRG